MISFFRLLITKKQLIPFSNISYENKRTQPLYVHCTTDNDNIIRIRKFVNLQPHLQQHLHTTAIQRNFSLTRR